MLDKRTHMLKIHQRMGLITTIPLIATVATSLNAGGRSTSTASRDLHTALGAADGRLVFHDRLLCHPRAQDTVEPKPAARSVSTKPWLGFMAPE